MNLNQLIMMHRHGLSHIKYVLLSLTASYPKLTLRELVALEELSEVDYDTIQNNRGRLHKAGLITHDTKFKCRGSRYFLTPKGIRLLDTIDSIT